MLRRTIGSDLELNTTGFDQHIGNSKKMCSCSRENFFNIPQCDCFFGMFSSFGEMKSFTWQSRKGNPILWGVGIIFMTDMWKTETYKVQSLLDETILWWIGWSWFDLLTRFATKFKIQIIGKDSQTINQVSFLGRYVGVFFEWLCLPTSSGGLHLEVEVVRKALASIVRIPMGKFTQHPSWEVDKKPWGPMIQWKKCWVRFVWFTKPKFGNLTPRACPWKMMMGRWSFPLNMVPSQKLC